MQTKPLPEIEQSELRAVRQFLTSYREEERQARAGRLPREAQGLTTLRHGIARARLRSRGKSDS